MENGATNSPHGMDTVTENCSMSSTADAQGRTKPTTFCGAAGDITEQPIPDRSSLLSDDERLLLAKIRRNRDNCLLPTLLDCDFMLETLERLSR
jgi:hypothetical protein